MPHKIVGTVFFLLMYAAMQQTVAQISPGELSKFHEHLEGMSNCTKCHELGAKVSSAKCAACHLEIKLQIDNKKGYHATAEVKGKECYSCHSDHHGRNFQIVKFDTIKFNHAAVGFKLEGKHLKKNCASCHKPANIKDTKLKAKAFTYLGLTGECLLCHDDYHQKTLSATCTNCHNFEKFNPAEKFNHNSAKFKLLGKHQTVSCEKCHKKDIQNEKKFQHFTGLAFNKCVDCHEDVHKNKFGQDCAKCHTENSFLTLKRTDNFDHDKTGYPLQEKHSLVDCKKCHKVNYTNKLPHEKCTDCHSDYHKGQFNNPNTKGDCSKCHTLRGFTPSLFTIEQHNSGTYKLNGGHIATPCLDCHKKEKDWNFRNIGAACSDCHTDVHKPNIPSRYYPESTCNSCHSEVSWATINFEHAKTKFALTGKHTTTNCRLCHFSVKPNEKPVQKFAGLSQACTNCHTDSHRNQFEMNGITDCSRCHKTENWKAENFDHDKTLFKLDGKHKNVACAKCHKPNNSDKFILYKIKEFKCESCHSS